MKKNLLWMAISFIVFLLCYPLLVHISVPPRGDVPWMFRTYLLESRSKSGPNIWIDSGSNSFYSIDTKMLAEAFKRNVYMINDTYGMPWDLKFYEILNYVQAGDVVILPMEFEQYVKKQSIGSSLSPDIWYLDAWKEYSGYMDVQRPWANYYLDGWHTHPGAFIFLWRRYFSFFNKELLSQNRIQFEARVSLTGGGALNILPFPPQPLFAFLSCKRRGMFLRSYIKKNLK